MVNEDLEVKLAVLAVGLLIGLGVYVFYMEPGGPASTSSQTPTTPLSVEADDAPKEEAGTTLSLEEVETAPTDALQLRWEQHIKRIGAKRVRKKTMKLVQQAMGATGQARVNYLREAAKLEPEDEAIGKMLKEAERSLLEAKRNAKKTVPVRGPTRNSEAEPPHEAAVPEVEPEVIVRPRMLED